MRRDRYKTSIAFIDLLFNITIGITMLFIIAFLLINPVAKKGDIILNAEFVIAMSWGVLIGTFSSIFIASPLIFIFGFKQDINKT